MQPWYKVVSLHKEGRFFSPDEFTAFSYPRCSEEKRLLDAMSAAVMG